MSKRFIVAAVAGSVTMLLVGFLLYGLVFAGLFREGALTIPGVMKQSPEILWIVAGQVGFGILVTLVISWRGTTSFAGGALTGALFGFLMAIGYDFAQYGTSNLWSLTATLLDPFITALMIGSAGGVIGFVLGRDAANQA
ncbi:MAG: hypothetical protein ACR2QX_08285 [Woeseiaceae bacterium]